MNTEVRNLSLSYPGQTKAAVDSVSFNVAPGEILALLGPSGCGKTSTLRLIAGFERPDGGSITLEGREISQLPPEKRGVGLVFQDYALFPHLTALDNVAFALDRIPRRERQEQAREYLRKVGLKDFLDRYPQELSGGQQQRVALARALAADPALILLDEPFSNLDAALRDSTRREVRRILKAAGTSAILVTHDQEEALSFADRIAVMRSGRLEQTDTPEEIYHFPRTPFVAQFLGRTNLFSGYANGESAVTSLGVLKLHSPAKGRVLLSLRPEHLFLERVPAPGVERPTPDARENPSGDRPAFPCGAQSPSSCGLNRILNGPDQETALVQSREFRGHDVTFRIRHGRREYIVHTDYACGCLPGDQVRLIQREAAMVLEGPLVQSAQSP